MKTKYIGTHLSPEEHKQFGVRAAELGISKSALLRRLAEEALGRVGRPALSRTRKRKEAA